MIEVDERGERTLYRKRVKHDSATRTASERAALRRRLAANSKARNRYKAKAVARFGVRCEACLWSPERDGLSQARAIGLLQSHHIVPVCCDGKDTGSNFLLLCPNCHALAHALSRMVLGVGGKRYWYGPTTKTELREQLGHFTGSVRFSGDRMSKSLEASEAK